MGDKVSMSGTPKGMTSGVYNESTSATRSNHSLLKNSNKFPKMTSKATKFGIICVTLLCMSSGKSVTNLLLDF